MNGPSDEIRAMKEMKESFPGLAPGVCRDISIRVVHTCAAYNEKHKDRVLLIVNPGRIRAERILDEVKEEMLAFIKERGCNHKDFGVAPDPRVNLGVNFLLEPAGGS